MTQKIDKQLELGVLKGKLLASYQYLLDQNDGDNASKIKQLAEKLVKEEFAIAFCGHFSAGKSRMINTLLGEKILPSSPIPTSANLVKVKKGEDYAKVFFKKEKPRLYYAPYDYEKLKNYCKDGDQIEEIVFSYKNINIPENTVIMDTPGIDSVDDAHRVATESAIYFADLIFYVMDYNHVQSELNFMFIKDLTEIGKEVYLVINQIDKHIDKEISFLDFKNSVAESFETWGVKPAEIFYTSLTEEEHEHNQFANLKYFLRERLEKKDVLIPESVSNSLYKIIDDHFNLKTQKSEEELAPFKEVLNELSEDEYQNLETSYNSLFEQREALDNNAEKIEEEFDVGVSNILDSAYLMSFETRQLAESYLEACQPNFKAGIIFRKQKTLDEKKRRLDVFYDDMLEITKSQIEWHLRNFLLDFINKHKIEKAQLTLKIQSCSVTFSNELLIVMVRTGAVLSSTTVMNYTKDIINEIKAIAQKCLFDIKEEILDVLENKNQIAKDKIASKLEAFLPYIEAFEQVRKYEEEGQKEKQKIQLLIREAGVIETKNHDLFQLVEQEFEIADSQSGKAQEECEKTNDQFRAKNTREEKIIPQVESEDRIQRTADKLKQTAQLVKDLPGFRNLATELVEQGERLSKQGFTVALFGAFSAGKSSFANALLGEGVLPVSPNPMTAAINKIKPTSDLYKHETVIIKLKDEKAILQDVNNSLKLFDIQAATLGEAAEWIEDINDSESYQGVTQKSNYTFLQAFKRGFPEFKEKLGSILETTMSEFADYVAKEERSCFVEWIDLYYDCQLTRQGITLVDTPGADSINTRHTGVAFDYIKNSDAILFVTYYNHAFSRVDREFIIQLGRVKDSFQLDKMFFIINAIDLAEDEEEKELVVNYVEEQLMKYGVIKPHLHPLSSLDALKEKKGKENVPTSGMRDFEESFYHFIAHDLANMAARASEEEIKRVYALIEKLIENTQEDALIKQKRRESIKTEKYNIDEILEKQTTDNMDILISKEIEELIFYIKQRVFLRFSDFFKDSFNSSVLRDDQGNLKLLLRNALNDLIEQIGFDFAQEMRATTLRVDRFSEKIMDKYQKDLIEKVHDVNSDLSFSSFQFKNDKEVDFKRAFENISQKEFDKALSYFKNAKSFFEKDEKRFMSDEIQRVLSIAADEYLEYQEKRMMDSYKNVLEDQFAELISQMKAQKEDFYLSLFSALDGGLSAEELELIKESLGDFL